MKMNINNYEFPSGATHSACLIINSDGFWVVFDPTASREVPETPLPIEVNLNPAFDDRIILVESVRKIYQFFYRIGNGALANKDELAINLSGLDQDIHFLKYLRVSENPDLKNLVLIQIKTKFDEFCFIVTNIYGCKEFARRMKQYFVFLRSED
jgi:hypothetical protein